MFHQDPQGLQYTVLLNLPGDSFAYYAVAATMVLTLLGSFPLLLLPCFEILETNIRKYEMKEWLIENKRENRLFVTDSTRFWSRTLQVVLITILAYFVPKFDSINAINILCILLLLFSWLFYLVVSLELLFLNYCLLFCILRWLGHEMVCGKRLKIGLFWCCSLEWWSSAPILLLFQWLETFRLFLIIIMSSVPGRVYDLLCFEIINSIVSFISPFHLDWWELERCSGIQGQRWNSEDWIIRVFCGISMGRNVESNGSL